jgi:hypothetical protein
MARSSARFDIPVIYPLGQCLLSALMRQIGSVEEGEDFWLIVASEDETEIRAGERTGDSR